MSGWRVVSRFFCLVISVTCLLLVGCSAAISQLIV
jgi:uncharacterized protein YcfL